MSRHFENLNKTIPDLDSKEILDLGAGRGEFMLEVLRSGGRVRGLEYNSQYITIARENAARLGVKINITQGQAENIPFADKEFDFVNMAEVLEHVQDPVKSMQEVYRILRSGGQAYVSVPSRYSFYDTHYHLYFVNWLPRKLADGFIKIFGRQKKYDDHSAGHQRLGDMHYYTFTGAKKMFEKIGFVVEDLRLVKIQKSFSGSRGFFTKMIYLLSRGFYVRAFHYLITKK